MNADETGFYCRIKPVLIYKVSLVIALEDLKMKTTLRIITKQKKSIKERLKYSWEFEQQRWQGCQFFIIAYSSHPLLLTEHAANGLVEAPLKLRQKMKDLLLCVHVVVKT